jgi:peptidoglycan/xylan/chitin deacetylase (PgdA/CDA1 family)
LALSSGAEHLLRVAWRFPFAKFLAPGRPVILLYHGVPAGHSGKVFEQHVQFLRQYFEFVSPHDIERTRRPHERPRVLLTFDDGFRNNSDVVAPILRKYDVPAAFFVSSRHTTPGKYLWFTYLQALEKWFPARGLSFRSVFFDMSQGERQRSVQRLSKMLLSLLPHPAAMYDAIERELPSLRDFVTETELSDRYAGMTAEQVAELGTDPLFSIGAHTLDHPFLTKCEPAEALRQVYENRTWLEAVCGRSCESIAYPAGDYSPVVLSLCRQAGFSHGYAVDARINLESRLELSRIGVYSDSTDILAFKVQWGTLLRSLKVPLG